MVFQCCFWCSGWWISAILVVFWSFYGLLLLLFMLGFLDEFCDFKVFFLCLEFLPSVMVGYDPSWEFHTSYECNNGQASKVAVQSRYWLRF